jgi:3-hydroxybutyryl-CoA dehydratase
VLTEEDVNAHGGSGKDAFEALPVGRRVTVRKTVGESDVYLFAGITGDHSPNHTDEEYMRSTRYGRRVAHGALAIGFMSAASTKIIEGLPGTIVSYGYDRVRFPAPLFIGDTVTVTYEIVERDPAALTTFARVTCTTQRGDVVAAATHILKIVELVWTSARPCWCCRVCAS